jgi:cell wall-associated NlpC family hydrolase
MKRVATVLVVAATLVGCGPKPMYRTAPDLVDRSGSGATVDDERVAKAAQPWMNGPYRSGGEDYRGIDCSSLTQNILGDLGVDLPRTVRAQLRVGDPVPVSKLRAGDLIFFRLSGGAVDHVGVALDENRFVHASTSRGVVVDLFMDKYFARTFVEARRVLASN